MQQIYTQQTQMEKEAQEVPQVIAKQLRENMGILSSLCNRIREVSPQFAVTIGRGSSDHACTYAKYLIETHLGLVTSSAAPSIVTIYRAKLQLKNALIIGISQSGQSPDICEMMREARRSGAITVAIVNVIDSPLADAAEFVVPMWAGEEKAVAASKSYIASLTALVMLIALFMEDKKLQKNLNDLPSALADVLNNPWHYCIEELKNITQTLVIARGYGFPIAQEAALKFKETASLQAEAFSAAEVLHGPFALIQKNHPYLLFAQNDITLPEILKLTQKILALGGKPILAFPPQCKLDGDLEIGATLIRMPTSLGAILDPIMIILGFYMMVAKLAVIRGHNPDAPPNLNKITETF